MPICHRCVLAGIIILGNVIISGCSGSDSDTPPKIAYIETDVPVDEWELYFSRVDDPSAPRGWGFKTPDGQVVVKPEFDDVYRLWGNRFAVERDGLKYVYDERGVPISSRGFADIDLFSEGLVWFQQNFDSGFSFWGIISSEGRIVREPSPPFEGNPRLFSEGYASFVSETQGTLFVNREGEIVARFGYAGNFSEGLAFVRGFDENDKSGYVDHDFNIVIPCQFDAASEFRGGLAAVQVGEKIGYINRTGEYVAQPIFDYGTLFKDGLALVRREGLCYVIDERGNQVTSPMPIDEFMEGLDDSERRYLSTHDERDRMLSLKGIHQEWWHWRVHDGDPATMPEVD